MPSHGCAVFVLVSRWAREFLAKHAVQGGAEQLPVQILVVVASIQMGSLKSEVEKGSMCTAFGQGLVDEAVNGCLGSSSGEGLSELRYAL